MHFFEARSIFRYAKSGEAEATFFIIKKKRKKKKRKKKTLKKKTKIKRRNTQKELTQYCVFDNFIDGAQLFK